MAASNGLHLTPFPSLVLVDVSDLRPRLSSAPSVWVVARLQGPERGLGRLSHPVYEVVSAPHLSIGAAQEDAASIATRDEESGLPVDRGSDPVVWEPT